MGRFELPTLGLGNQCSIHLSYSPQTDRQFTTADGQCALLYAVRSVCPTSPIYAEFWLHIADFLPPKLLKIHEGRLPRQFPKLLVWRSNLAIPARNRERSDGSRRCRLCFATPRPPPWLPSSPRANKPP